MNSHVANPALDAEKTAAARAVLGYVGSGNLSHWQRALLDAYSAADLTNRRKLTQVFPFEGHAYELYVNEGTESLRKWGGLK